MVVVSGCDGLHVNLAHQPGRVNGSFEYTCAKIGSDVMLVINNLDCSRAAIRRRIAIVSYLGPYAVAVGGNQSDGQSRCPQGISNYGLSAGLSADDVCRNHISI